MGGEALNIAPQPAVKQYRSDKGDKFGLAARPLRRGIQSEDNETLSDGLLAGTSGQVDTLQIDLGECDRPSASIPPADGGSPLRQSPEDETREPLIVA